MGTLQVQLLFHFLWVGRADTVAGLCALYNLLQLINVFRYTFFAFAFPVPFCPRGYLLQVLIVYGVAIDGNFLNPYVRLHQLCDAWGCGITHVYILHAQILEPRGQSAIGGRK